MKNGNDEEDELNNSRSENENATINNLQFNKANSLSTLSSLTSSFNKQQQQLRGSKTDPFL